MFAGSEKCLDAATAALAEPALALGNPPPAHGIVFGVVLAVPFWCCFGAVLWALG